jgi:hypothetical protein
MTSFLEISLEKSEVFPIIDKPSGKPYPAREAVSLPAMPPQNDLIIEQWSHRFTGHLLSCQQIHKDASIY